MLVNLLLSRYSGYNRALILSRIYRPLSSYPSVVCYLLNYLCSILFLSAVTKRVMLRQVLLSSFGFFRFFLLGRRYKDTSLTETGPSKVLIFLNVRLGLVRDCDETFRLIWGHSWLRRLFEGWKREVLLSSMGTGSVGQCWWSVSSSILTPFDGYSKGRKLSSLHSCYYRLITLI